MREWHEKPGGGGLLKFHVEEDSKVLKHLEKYQNLLKFLLLREQLELQNPLQPSWSFLSTNFHI